MADLFKLKNIISTTDDALLSDLIPEIIDPLKLSYTDDFQSTVGSISGYPLTEDSESQGAKSWTSSNITSDGNGNLSSSGSNRVAYFDANDSDVELSTTINLQPSGYAGVTCRYVDSSNYITAWISSTGVFKIQRRTSGASATLAEVRFSPEFSKEYNLRVVLAGNTITAYAAGLKLQVNNNQGRDSVNHGLYFGSEGQIIIDFKTRYSQSDYSDIKYKAYYDYFNGASGTINSSSLKEGQNSVGAKTWTSAGITYNGDGFAQSTGSNRIAYMDVESENPNISVNLKLTDSGYAGVCLRYIDSSNYIMVWLSPTGVFRLQRRTGGSSTTLDEVNFTPVIGRIYNINVVTDGDNITVESDGMILSVVNSQGNTSTLHGIYFGSTGQLIGQFKALTY